MMEQTHTYQVYGKCSFLRTLILNSEISYYLFNEQMLNFIGISKLYIN